MHSISSLHSLVQSLTKTEKRYFRLNSDLQKGEKKYLALFDLLEKHLVLDKTALEELTAAFPDTSIEPARKHLHQAVMKSLRQFDGSKDIEAKLGNMLHESRILHRKGLHQMSLDVLGKVKKEAETFEKNMYFLLAARQEMRFLAEKQFFGMDEQELVERQSRIRELIDLESWVNRHHALYEILLFRYLRSGLVRSDAQIAQLNDLLLEEYQLLNRQTSNSFESSMLHLHFQSVYFRMTGNTEASLDGYYEMDELLQRHITLWRNTPETYIQILEGTLVGLLNDRKYEQISYFLDRLRAVEAMDSVTKLSIPYLIANIELQSLISRGRFDEAIDQWQRLRPDFESCASNLPAQVNSRLVFTVCKLYFLTANYNAALQLVNQTLNKPAGLMDGYTRTNFLLFNLQINSMLNNMDYVHYALRSVERKLKSTRKLYNSEQLVILILKKWMNFKPTRQYIKKIKNLEQKPYEKQIIEDLTIREWVNRLNQARS